MQCGNNLAVCVAMIRVFYLVLDHQMSCRCVKCRSSSVRRKPYLSLRAQRTISTQTTQRQTHKKSTDMTVRSYLSKNISMYLCTKTRPSPIQSHQLLIITQSAWRVNHTNINSKPHSDYIVGQKSPPTPGLHGFRLTTTFFLFFLCSLNSLWYIAAPHRMGCNLNLCAQLFPVTSINLL